MTQIVKIVQDIYGQFWLYNICIWYSGYNSMFFSHEKKEEKTGL